MSASPLLPEIVCGAVDLLTDRPPLGRRRRPALPLNYDHGHSRLDVCDGVVYLNGGSVEPIAVTMRLGVDGVDGRR